MFSGFIFLGMILSVIAVLLGGDERFILLRESYVTGIMGLVFLGSLFFARPLIFYFAERFSSYDPQMNDKWEKLPSFRHTFRLLTMVWGFSLLLETCVKIVLVYSLSVPTFLLISPFFAYGCLFSRFT